MVVVVVVVVFDIVVGGTGRERERLRLLLPPFVDPIVPPLDPCEGRGADRCFEMALVRGGS